MTTQEITQSIREGGAWNSHEIQKNDIVHSPAVIILDDDPTGTQTVHEIPVITDYSEETIEREFRSSPVFFILTNSRSMQVDEANALAERLGIIIRKLSSNIERKVIIISRSDSTLRGHYPNEVDALAKGLGCPNAKQILIPAFFEGGRYTYRDIHYVKEEETFVPAAQTPFAKDHTFGYRSSDLKEWIIEKSKGMVRPEQIASISVEALRKEPTEVIHSLMKQDGISHIVVNATSYPDLQLMAKACLTFEEDLIYRTAASFVNAISGISPTTMLDPGTIRQQDEKTGGLLIVGSYVPKTNEQLAYLMERSDARALELNVPRLLNADSFSEEIRGFTQKIEETLATGQDVILYTSRELVSGKSKEESLQIVNKVSQGLINIVKGLRRRPGYIIAKGGITSSDIATKALSLKRGWILGQILKGVPVWRLGKEAKFPHMPYIVFPGNVGDKTSLFQLVSSLHPAS